MSGIRTAFHVFNTGKRSPYSTGETLFEGRKKADRITSTARSSSIKAIFAKLSQPAAVQILPTAAGLDLTAVPVPRSKAKLKS